MLISLVTETEDDVFESRKLVLAVRELERLVREVLAELDGVVRGFTLTIGSHNEENAAVLRELAQVLKVAFLGVTYERSQAELGLGLLCETDGVLLCRASLGTVENNDALFLLYDVARTVSDFGGAGLG